MRYCVKLNKNIKKEGKKEKNSWNIFLVIWSYLNNVIVYCDFNFFCLIMRKGKRKNFIGRRVMYRNVCFYGNDDGKCIIGMLWED